jgi:hypothetical protein
MGKKGRKVSAAPFPQQAQKPKLNINMSKESKSAILYRDNIAALKKRDPELAARIEATEQVYYQVDMSRPGALPNLVRKADGFRYYQGDNPMANVKAEMEGLKLKNARLAIILGFGLGYELMYFAEALSGKQNTAAMLVVEKDPEIFKAALQTINLVPVLAHDQVDLAVGCDENELYLKMRDFFNKGGRHILAKAVKPVYHMSSMVLAKDYYLSALRILRESATYQVLNYGNDPKDSLIGIENMLFNLNEILENPGVNLLYEKFRGKPAVVISTGPSLDKNKHLLKGLEDKALLLCPDTSLRPLIDAGIKPHMVTSLERTPGTIKLLGNFTAEQVDDVYLAGCPVILKEVYEGYPGPRIIVYRSLDHFKWLGVDRGMLDIKKSAGNMAFKVAEALGCDPIILIGQDLAFGEDGTTHAKGTARGEGGERLDAFEKAGTLEVPGNLGGMVKTSKIWYQFLKTYEVDVANYTGTCINSTEGGAFITGTQVMPFAAAIEKHVQESYQPMHVIKENLAHFSSDEADRDVKRIRKLMDDTENDVRQIMSHCQDGFNKCQSYREQLEGALNEADKLEALRPELKKIERECMEPKLKAVGLKHTFQFFLAHVLQSYHIQFDMDIAVVPEKYDDLDLARIEIIVRQAEWYAVINDLATICLNALLEAKLRMDNPHGGQVDVD